MKLFCKTFLLTQTAVIIIGLINMLDSLKFNFMLTSIALEVMRLCSFTQLGLQVINGMRLNEWFYQDVMENLNKKRTKKGLLIFIACQIAAIVLLNLIPIFFKLFYEDLFGDFSDYGLSYMKDIENLASVSSKKDNLGDIDSEALRVNFGISQNNVYRITVI